MTEFRLSEVYASRTYVHHPPTRRWACASRPHAGRGKNPSHRQASTWKALGNRSRLGVGAQLPKLWVYLDFSPAQCVCLRLSAGYAHAGNLRRHLGYSYHQMHPGRGVEKFSVGNTNESVWSPPVHATSRCRRRQASSRAGSRPMTSPHICTATRGSQVTVVFSTSGRLPLGLPQTVVHEARK